MACRPWSRPPCHGRCKGTRSWLHSLQCLCSQPSVRFLCWFFFPSYFPLLILILRFLIGNIVNSVKTYGLFLKFYSFVIDLLLSNRSASRRLSLVSTRPWWKESILSSTKPVCMDWKLFWCFLTTLLTEQVVLFNIWGTFFITSPFFSIRATNTLCLYFSNLPRFFPFVWPIAALHLSHHRLQMSWNLYSTSIILLEKHSEHIFQLYVVRIIFLSLLHSTTRCFCLPLNFQFLSYSTSLPFPFYL